MDNEAVEMAALGFGGAALSVAIIGGVVCLVRRTLPQNGQPAQLEIQPASPEVLQKIGLDIKDSELSGVLSNFVEKRKNLETIFKELADLPVEEAIQKLSQYVDINDLTVMKAQQKIQNHLVTELQKPQFRQLFAEVFANPSGGSKKLTINITPGKGLGMASAARGRYIKASQDEFIAWDLFVRNLRHELDHDGRLYTGEIPGLNARECAVYDIFDEALARDTEWAIPVTEGGNIAGDSDPMIQAKPLRDIYVENILGKHESDFPNKKLWSEYVKDQWDTFLKLRETNPVEFEATFKKVRSFAVVNSMDQLTTALEYARQVMGHSQCGVGRLGNIENLRKVCETYLIDKGLDIDIIWPKIEALASGREKITYIGNCFNSSGHLVASEVESFLAKVYKENCKHFEEALSRRQSTGVISIINQEIEKWRQRVLVSRDMYVKNSPFLQELIREKGSQWVNEHLSELMQFSMDKLNGKSCIVNDGTLGILYQRKQPNGDIAFFDTQGQLRRYHNVSANELVYIEPNGITAVVVNANGAAKRVRYPKGVRTTFDSCYQEFYNYCYAEQAWANSVQRPAAMPQAAGRTRVVVDEVAPRIEETQVPPSKPTPRAKAGERAPHRTDSDLPAVAPQAQQAPSVKKQLFKMGGVFVGQAALMMVASVAGRRAQHWDDAQEKYGLGELMGISPDTTSAMAKAGTYVGVGGGLLVAGTAVASKWATKSTRFASWGVKGGKVVPYLGTVIGVGMAGVRAWDGDWKGVGLELTSAVLSLGPVICTGADLALNGYMAYRDAQMKDGTYTFTMTDGHGNPVQTSDGQNAIGAVINYKHDVEDGPASFYDYDSEKGPYLSVVGQFKNGERDGQWVTLSPGWDPEHPEEQDKHILERATYDKGKLISFTRVDSEGHLVAQLEDISDQAYYSELSSNSLDAFAVPFLTGIEESIVRAKVGHVGQYTEYWTDENGISTGKVKCIGQYKNGERTGRWLTVSPEWDPEHPEEHVLECAHFENDRLVGDYFRLDANENVLVEGNFTDGEYREYWTDENGLSTGIPRYEGQYKNGQAAGVWVAYSADGEITEKIDYDNRVVYKYVTVVDEEGKKHIVEQEEPFELYRLCQDSAVYPSTFTISQEDIWAGSIRNSIPKVEGGPKAYANPNAVESFPNPSPGMDKPAVLSESSLTQSNSRVNYNSSFGKHQSSLTQSNSRVNSTPSFGNHRGLDDLLGASPQAQIGNDKGLDNAIEKKGTDASKVESTETSQKLASSKTRGRASSRMQHEEHSRRHVGRSGHRRHS